MSSSHGSPTRSETRTRTGVRRHPLAVRTVAVITFLVAVLGLTVAPDAMAAPKPTIVLVHGAFTDASGWRDVKADLSGQGYAVQTFDNPLRGPAYDAAALQKKLGTIRGPIVLVGHSYGGSVITDVHDRDVVANVYIAAFAPAQGEFALGLLDPIRYPGSRLLPPALQVKPVVDPSGPGGRNLDGYIAQPYFRDIFAQDLSPAKAAQLYSHQKSVALAANLEPSGPPSWRTVPSWYLVSRQDRVIPPALQRFLAKRAAPGRTSEVNAAHASPVSQPGAVAAVIEKAARATQR
ncbi:alpha/beta hydrolase [Gordonia soli]|uniref:Putative hydrolase n=1 Tax=Gordonia soli NBRC 108243 TaxID=1223545 RepID=M0QFZ8_9ACTN|nr:alpha/beta hydrolase [Gordonia soli]GAC67354.1 putative hydrolase [Gordonia soli NBRC 108243]